MALVEGQAQIRGLVLGPGTPYTLYRFNPFKRTVRADQTQPRPWNHGSWSGAEWQAERTIPMTVIVSDSPVSMATWMPLDQALAEAFAPVGDSIEDVDLTFCYGGREYLVRGRPRMVDPGTDRVGSGWSVTQCAFTATDPLIYSAELHTTDPIPLPTFSGGLTLPIYLPAYAHGVKVGGEAALVNEGTTETGLLLRIDGPVSEPRVALRRPDGLVQTARWRGLELPAGQWIEVDTAARQAFLNGLPGSSVHPGFSVDWPLLPKGESVISFNAVERTAATLTVSYRDAWW